MGVGIGDPPCFQQKGDGRSRKRDSLAAMSCLGFDVRVEVATELRALAPCDCSKPAQTFARALAVSLITQRFRFLSRTNSLSFRFCDAGKVDLNEAAIDVNDPEAASRFVFRQSFPFHCRTQAISDTDAHTAPERGSPREE
jgi:hypothetical protein